MDIGLFWGILLLLVLFLRAENMTGVLKWFSIACWFVAFYFYLAFSSFWQVWYWGAFSHSLLHWDVRVISIVILMIFHLFFRTFLVFSFLFLWFSFDFSQKCSKIMKLVLIVAPKKFVMEMALIVWLPNFMEIIHVEL